MTRKFEIVSKYQDADLPLPKRATKQAAGYDLQAATDFVLPSVWRVPFLRALKKIRISEQLTSAELLEAQTTLKPFLVPTGVKVYLNENEYLMIANRSSNPLKRSLVLPNGVGIIDADYVDNPQNEGEIFVQMINWGLTDRTIKQGERIAQGIFMPYLVTDDDQLNEKATRTGGFGSSGVN
ncbi:dUTP pyrophosphatase [Weissella uvarum]|uniref:dUTP diphosphatase n=1 Tax=Weissella uvarum TaxID=1479233 RepID=UPI00196213C2|nr:dUTP diphosphatase [Weissella uvarum]MBM7616656.1 dUTP pyrophosphatase [Weissella uvarum]MCM0594886.1 dUTP diphosphatase [Weissella uvarum]